MGSSYMPASLTTTSYDVNSLSPCSFFLHAIESPEGVQSTAPPMEKGRPACRHGILINENLYKDWTDLSG
jgi:hypothetical protein